MDSHDYSSRWSFSQETKCHEAKATEVCEAVGYRFDITFCHVEINCDARTVGNVAVSRSEINEKGSKLNSVPPNLVELAQLVVGRGVRNI